MIEMTLPSGNLNTGFEIRDLVLFAICTLHLSNFKEYFIINKYEALKWLNVYIWYMNRSRLKRRYESDTICKESV